MGNAVTHECSAGSQGSPGLKGVLIVEPDPLLRWSVTTYLSQWFAVLPADTVTAAAAALDAHRVEVVLISDLLPERSRQMVEASVLHANPEAAVIYMVTSLPRRGVGGKMRCIEKPFQLAALARLLGVGAPQASGA